jgi:hypothetical protein
VLGPPTPLVFVALVTITPELLSPTTMDNTIKTVSGTAKLKTSTNLSNIFDKLIRTGYYHNFGVKIKQQYIRLIRIVQR